MPLENKLRGKYSHVCDIKDMLFTLWDLVYKLCQFGGLKVLKCLVLIKSVNCNNFLIDVSEVS